MEPRQYRVWAAANPGPLAAEAPASGSLTAARRLCAPSLPHLGPKPEGRATLPLAAGSGPCQCGTWPPGRRIQWAPSPDAAGCCWRPYTSQTDVAPPGTMQVRRGAPCTCLHPAGLRRARGGLKQRLGQGGQPAGAQASARGRRGAARRLHDGEDEAQPPGATQTGAAGTRETHGGYIAGPLRGTGRPSRPAAPRRPHFVASSRKVSNVVFAVRTR